MGIVRNDYRSQPVKAAVQSSPWIVLVCVFLLSGCMQNPLGGKSIADDIFHPALPDQATSTSLLGIVSLANSTVTLSAGSVQSGSSITVTFHAYDYLNNPITSGGLSVAFTRSGGTSTGNFSAVTDNGNGTYTATFTGVLAGTATSIGATVSGNAITSVLPTETVTAGAASLISIVSGNNQTAVAGAALGSNLVVLVTDAAGNAVNGQQVDWVKAGGNGVALGSATSNTNASGNATNTLTLGTLVGNYTATATIHGTATSVTFTTETAIAGAASSIAVSSGNNQSATVNTALGSALVAIVKDVNNNVVSGQQVDWTTTGGTLGVANSLTDASGLSTDSLTIGTVTGAYTVTATIHGTATSTTFTATATPGAINNFLLSAVPATASTGVGFNFTITARDSFNNTKTNYTGIVAFTSTDGSAVLPGNYTFLAGDLGVKSNLSFTFVTSGVQTITVTQVAGGSPTATTSNITVSVSGLLAAYSFSENAGVTIADQSGNGNTQTILDGSATWVTGNTGTAVNFSGSGGASYAKAASSSAALAVTSGFTMMAWVKRKSMAGTTDTPAISYYAKTGDAWYYRLTPVDDQWTSSNPGKPNCIFRGNAHAPATLSGNTALVLNTWTHLACTYDGTTVKMYINGALDNSTVIVDALSTHTALANYHLYLGGDDHGSWSSNYPYVLDDVRVYDHAVTLGELTTLMNTAVAP